MLPFVVSLKMAKIALAFVFSFLPLFLIFYHSSTLQINNTLIESPLDFRGSNLFFYQITSDTCAYHALDRITKNDLCVAAIRDHNYGDTQLLANIHHECMLKPRPDITSIDTSYNLKTSSKCTQLTPCFCTSSYYIQHNYGLTHRKLSQDNGHFSVTWNLDLGGKESLLESSFLKAAFEQSVKDYINNDILCSDDLSKKGAEFFGVEILSETNKQTQKWKAVSGNGKCRGKPQKCKKPLNLNALEVEISDDDDSRRLRKAVSGNGKCKGNVAKCKVPIQARRTLVADDDAFDDIDEDSSDKHHKIVTAVHAKNGFCDIFLSSTIFDAFRERLLMAAFFQYDVDVDVIDDLEGNLNLKYDVTFEPAKSDGLDQIEEVALDANEPVPINIICTESSPCFTQRAIIKGIFEYYNIAWDDSKHECLYEGINCNEEDVVTHIWMVNYGLDGKTIPELFGSLHSLKGLFLGRNQLVGTIPSQLGSIRKLQMLWLEDNALTGTIPSQLGNLRPLLELNLHNNQLTGTIPSQFGKLKKLQMLNLGRNALHGPIPGFFRILDGQGKNCSLLSGSMKKLGLTWLNQQARTTIEPLTELRTLSLYNNRLSGTIPGELGELFNLADLSLAENNLSGEIPTKLGDLRNLNVLDLHGNSFIETIPTEIGKLRQLKIVNLYNNRLEKTIPTSLGELIQLNELILDNNVFTGPIPTALGALRKLEYLTFSGNKMSGEIPTELGNLVSLKNLDIRGISVAGKQTTDMESATGTIPTELGNLKAWKHVIFEDNGLTGPIPSEFGKLESSTTLWLKNQQLSGTISTELAKLTSLSTLSFGNNALEGPIPSVFGALSSVTTFDIGSNTLTGGIPEEMANMNQLQYFSLDNLNLTGQIPTALGKLSSLKYLSIGDNSLTGEIPSEFGQLQDLQAFKLGHNKISGEIPTELGKLNELQRLSLGSNKLMGGIPSEFGTIASLTHVDLGGNTLTGPIPIELANLQQLEALGLGANKLTGSIPSEFGMLSKLENIALGHNNLDGTLPTELAMINGLKKLDFGDNMLTGPIPSEFGTFAALEVMIIGDNGMTGTIPTELSNINSLEVIDIASNDITGNIPSEITSLPSLESLTISGNDIIGDLWFMCNLQSLTQQDSIRLNCSNYCGTEDEQCNNVTAPNAVCGDVGCSGPGVPSCTAHCRWDYSSCSAGADEMLFQLDIYTDGKAWETSWQISSDDDMSIVWQNDGSYNNYESVIETRCVTKGCYRFELLDSGGDGICCGENNDETMKRYSLVVDGNEEVNGDPRFASLKMHKVGSCTAAPFPSSVSMEPSMEPSNVPTKYPTSMPSEGPSVLPTEAPTLMPSRLPSSMPSMEPSNVPTKYPTSMPSEGPSVLPTEAPTLMPSRLPSSLPSANPSIFPNVALSGTATQVCNKQFDFSLASAAIDGNTDGTFNNGSVSHTCFTVANPWWQVDLGDLYQIVRIVVWNRSDSCCSDRLSNSNILILADDGNTIIDTKTIGDSTDIELFTFSYGSGLVGRYVKVQSTSTDPLQIAEVEVYGSHDAPTDFPNVALSGTATQVCDFTSASLAIDGNSDGTFNNGSVSHTCSTVPNPWWQVDLGDLYQIVRIVVWNRSDSCCSGKLSNSNILILADDGNTIIDTKTIGDSTDIGGFTFSYGSGVVGRYVKVQSTSTTDPLQLAEVEVYAQ